jgi:trimethylamine--corrinoid protein Co-methyltransferase
MIQTSYTESRSVSFRVLTDEQVWAITRAALDILQHTGCNVLHKGARKLLRTAGAIVKDELVKVPQHIVDECIRTTPKGFVAFDRYGKRALEVEGRKSYYGTSTASPRTRDAFTGQIRETTVADIAFGARVADALPNIDWVMPMGSSQDVPALAADVHEFEAIVTNTTKPIVFIGYSARGSERVYEMAAEVAGGLDALRQKPFLIAYPEPISPLVYPDEVVERIFISADLFMPQIPGPTVQFGATGPVTLAGAIAQVVAESLMGVVLAQLRQPGTPCVLGANISVFDMSTTQLTVASPEMSLALAGQAEVAQSLGLPTWGLAGATDSKVLDAQAGIESAFSILAQGLAGLNLIHDVGYMDSAMVCSTEMLVLGNEAAGMAKRFCRGIEVNAGTLAVDVVEKVGPGGHFLQEDHTFHRFRQELWRPSLLARQDYSIWQAEGAKDLNQRIREKLEQIRQDHQVAPLPGDVATAIDRLKRKAEEEVARS